MNQSVYQLPISTQHKTQLKQNKIKIRVLSWNLAWAYGMGSEGVNYHPKPKTFFVRKLEKISKIVKDSKCDVALFQEVDFNSDRSHQINMAKFLSPKTLLPYVAEVTTWDLKYLPYPIWPIKNHWGKIDSGGLILSAYPIEKQKTHLLPKPKEKSMLFRALYLSRFLQTVKINFNNTKLNIINTHLEAFFDQNRLVHSKIICKELNKISKKIPTLFGGDFNAPPSWSKNRGPFKNEKDNYQNDHSFDYLQKNLNLKNCLDKKSVHNESKYFTFPATNPNRTLDHLYFSNHWECKEIRVISCGVISDHLPIIGTFELKE